MIYLAIVLSILFGCSVPEDRPKLTNPKFDKAIKNILDYTTPLLSVDELREMESENQDFILLDTREPNEFAISHIKGAQFVGYNHFDQSKVSSLPKDTKIVLYCSVGYRSSMIGKKLINLGFQDVYNVYGGMFEWVNKGYEVVDSKGNAANKIHGYNKSWSKWVENEKIEKIW